MTTSPEALREAVERLQSLNLTADAALPMSFSWVRPDVETLLSALQEAREALGPFAKIVPSSLFPADGSEGEVYELFLTDDPCAPVSGAELAKAREAYRALSPGGAEQ